MLLRAAVTLLLAATLAGPAVAHGIGADGPAGIGWPRQAWVPLSLGLAILWYVAGLLRMRGRARFDRVIGRRQVAAFAAGMAVLFAALVSPLDAIADDLFSAHMIQHLLLLLVAPPFLVASRPAVVFLWAFAPPTRKRIGRLWIGSGFGRGAEWLMHPVLVWLLFSGSFVFWHMPGPYQWAVENEAVHALEHLSFFVTALMYWTVVIEPCGRRRLGYGATLAFVATTAVVSALPGALIFLAPRPLYSVHAAGAAAWGLTLMQDQQLAGVIMWVPGGMVYLAAVQWVFLQWLREAEHRAVPRLRRTPLVPALLLAALLAGAGLAGAEAAAPGLPPGFVGDPDRGAVLINKYGCGSCHIVPGITGAGGLVGPPLTRFGSRIYIAGLLRNTPGNLVRWLRNPQRIVPGNAMPDMGVTAQDARDITAYLYTLR